MTKALSTDRAVPRARWYRIGVLLFLCQLMGHIDRNNIGIAGPALRHDLSLSTGAFGILLSAFFWGYVATQVPGGWLASRFSAKRVLIVVLVVWSIGAVASGLVTSYSGLIAARIVIGLAEGALFPTLGVLIAKWFPRREHGRAAGLVILSLPVSSVIMSPVAGLLVDRFGYHAMFIALAVPALILAVAVGIGLGESPAQDRWISEDERNFLIGAIEGVPQEHKRLLDVAKTPRILLLGVTYFLWQCGVYALALWVPSLVSQASKQGIGVVGLLSAIPFAVGAVALYVNSRRSDRSATANVKYIAVPLVIAGLALIAQHFVSDTLWVNLGFLSVCALGIYAPFGPWWAWVLRTAPDNQVGSVNGLVNAIGNFGGIVGPVIVGAAAGGGDLRNGFYVLGFALLLGAVMAVILDNAGRARPTRARARRTSPTAAASTAGL